VWCRLSQLLFMMKASSNDAAQMGVGFAFSYFPHVGSGWVLCLLTRTTSILVLEDGMCGALNGNVKKGGSGKYLKC